MREKSDGLTGRGSVQLQSVAEDGQRRRSGECAERVDELESLADDHRDEHDGDAQQNPRADGHCGDEDGDDVGASGCVYVRV